MAKTFVFNFLNFFNFFNFPHLQKLSKLYDLIERSYVFTYFLIGKGIVLQVAVDVSVV